MFYITIKVNLFSFKIFCLDTEQKLCRFFVFIGTTKASQAITGAHEGGIFSICVDSEDGKLLTGGGRDRKIVQWDNSYQRTGLSKEVITGAQL